MTQQEFTMNVAAYALDKASNNPMTAILSGGRLQNLEKFEVEYILGVISDVSDKVVPFIENNLQPSGDFADIRDLVIRAFMFYFDKTVEMVYNIRVDNENEIEFNFEELFNGLSGNNIPEYLQIKVNKIVPAIAMLSSDVSDYVWHLRTEDIALEDKIRAILLSSMRTAFEYALQLDLDDDSEFRQYLEND